MNWKRAKVDAIRWSRDEVIKNFRWSGMENPTNEQILRYEVIRDFWIDKWREYAREVSICKKENNVSFKFISNLLFEKYGADKIEGDCLENLKIFPGSRAGDDVDFSFKREIGVVYTIDMHTVIGRHIIIYMGNCYSHEELLYCVNKLMDEYAANKAALDSKLAELLEIEKEKKLKEVARQSIKSAVETQMTGTGYKWNLREEEDRCVLRIKMKHKRMIEVTLGYKSFIDKVPEMLEAIRQAENLLATIPYPVDIKGYGNNIEWNE